MADTDFKEGSYVDAIVSYVEGPQKFYLQPLSRSADLIYLAKKMNLLYGSSLTSEDDFSYALDEIAAMRDSSLWVAAPFCYPEEYQAPPSYNRAIILGRASPSMFTVFYVDYGNTANVPINSLKKLTQSFLKVPAIARSCRLVESVTQVDKFCRIVDGSHVVVYVAEGQADDYQLSVSLHITDGRNDQNVARILNEQLSAVDA